MSSFVFLEVHSLYSLCEGTLSIAEIVSFVKAQGLEYCSMSDTNGFYGLVDFLQACQKHSLKPVIATRLSHTSFEGLLVARNRKGYSEICTILSRLNLEEGYDAKAELIGTVSGNVFIITSDPDFLTAGLAGVLAEINPLRPNYYSTYRTARQNNVPAVLVYPVYFLEKDDFLQYRLLRAIANNKKLCALSPEEMVSEHAHFMDVRELLASYAHMPDAIRNTVRIASESSFPFSLGRPILPRVDSNSFERLQRLCYQNLSKRYRKATPQIIRRLEKELSIVEKKGYADYFLIVHDFVGRTSYTCGRGSAAASIISYLLFITHVDPVEHDLFFERFINAERPDLPDIDIDFPWDTRDEILEYIFQKYSPDNTAMVSNHIRFSIRSSVHEIAKVFGVPENEILKFSKSLTWYYRRDSDEFQALCNQNGLHPEMKKIARLAECIDGRVRHLSVHCGGVVITPRPVYTYIPVQKANKGVNIIQLEKEQAEELGLVKIDVLGNRSLAVVRDTLELVERHYGKHIDYGDFNPLHDEKTIETLSRGNTIGVFYVESPAMRQLQKKTRRGDYHHLVIHSSIIRPAANIYINEYVARLKGKPYKTLLPEMEAILGETYGIMCYQEDITKIAVRIGGLSLAEGQELRKVIGNKRKLDRKNQLKEKLTGNLRKREVKESVIRELWNMIDSFSGYSFCKPHSASYALLSFKACFLKVHYPAEFMGAVLKNQGGFYTPLAYISEARRLGIRIVRPEVNTSREHYFGRGDAIYVGFTAIKGLFRTLIKRLLEERETGGRYGGLIDFIKRTGANPSDTALLIKAECFRDIEPYNQAQLLYIARRYYRDFSTRHTMSLFSSNAEYIRPPDLRDLAPQQKAKNEMDLYGFIISCHPLLYYRKYKCIENPNVIRAKDLLKYVGQMVRVAGILITAKTVLTKQCELMQFVSFEDEETIFETTIFPKAFRQFTSLLSHQAPYILTGRVESQFDTISLNVYTVELIGHGP